MERVLLGAKVAASLAVLLGVCRLVTRPVPHIFLRAVEEWKGFLKEKSAGMGWYQRTQERLRRNGAMFYWGKRMSPERYLTVKCLGGLLGGALTWRLPAGYGIVTALMLFWLPDWWLRYRNRRDNYRMLPEIKLLYHALEIQIRAGVYVTDALTECYGCVTDKRLKQALLELAGDIVMKSDVCQALERFQAKFDNRHIDSLCITLIQACESGQAVELLADIGEQLRDMEAAVHFRQKSNLDRSITFYQLGMLAAVLGVMIYACIRYLFRAAAGL